MYSKAFHSSKDPVCYALHQPQWRRSDRIILQETSLFEAIMFSRRNNSKDNQRFSQLIFSNRLWELGFSRDINGESQCYSRSIIISIHAVYPVSRLRNRCRCLSLSFDFLPTGELQCLVLNMKKPSLSVPPVCVFCESEDFIPP